MFEALGNHPEGQGLHARHGLIAVGTVAHHTSQVGHFGKPAAIIFALNLDRKNHGGTVPSGPAANKRMARCSSSFRNTIGPSQT